MSLGQMMQVASAFGIVQGAMSWLFEIISDCGVMASVRRVASLLRRSTVSTSSKRARPARIFPQQGAAALSLSGLSVI